MLKCEKMLLQDSSSNIWIFFGIKPRKNNEVLAISLNMKTIRFVLANN